MHFRVYKLSPGGRNVSGHWIEAPSERDAESIAHDFCDQGTPTVELWQGAQRLAILRCEDQQHA